jgi:hydroxyacylglutathione hydrolase
MGQWTKATLLLAIALLWADRPAAAQQLQPGQFPARWIDGTDCAREDKVQVHWYNADMAILRQSLCTSFEGPFLYLLFGTDEALLLDSGAGGIDIASAVAGVVRGWESRSGRQLRRLVVAHSHAHGDHVAGDEALQALPYARIVDLSPTDVAGFFGIADWPGGMASLDLGGRMLDVIPIPGHEPSHIAIYDRLTGLLLTGDTLYPGRLYIPRNEFATYRRSVGRLATFAESAPVSWVLGGHIEMTSTPKVDFPFRSRRHENEHRLELPASALFDLNRALERMGSTPKLERHDHFIIFPTN